MCARHTRKLWFHYEVHSPLAPKSDILPPFSLRPWRITSCIYIEGEISSKAETGDEDDGRTQAPPCLALAPPGTARESCSKLNPKKKFLLLRLSHEGYSSDRVFTRASRENALLNVREPRESVNDLRDVPIPFLPPEDAAVARPSGISTCFVRLALLDPLEGGQNSWEPHSSGSSSKHGGSNGDVMQIPLSVLPSFPPFPFPLGVEFLGWENSNLMLMIARGMALLCSHGNCIPNACSLCTYHPLDRKVV